MPKRVYMPQDLNVHFGPTQEYPGGRVLAFKQGMIDLDDDMAEHPILARLAAPSAAAQSRQEKLMAVGQARNEAIAKAHEDYNKAVLALQTEEHDERDTLASAWLERSNAAAEAGTSFNEVHPDPGTARAVALTSAPQAVPVGGQMSVTTADEYDNLPPRRRRPAKAAAEKDE